MSCLASVPSPPSQWKASGMCEQEEKKEGGTEEGTGIKWKQMACDNETMIISCFLLLSPSLKPLPLSLNTNSMAPHSIPLSQGGRHY